ncbi:MAG: polysaccharide pyruvyl transferase family protein [Lachnospiraceae bacterium]|nr:polysaccharide pyruvyl transferase family protein [Lachnospiraceae bacterium]
MKYGLYYFKETHNIGDDIWAFAQSLFYPHIDYLIDNQSVYKFQTDQDEIVATIISAFVESWNNEIHFLLPESILPFFIGSYFKPTMWDYLKNEAMVRYLRQFQPIGVRSTSNVERLSAMGVNSYFSGCISLTLPSFKNDCTKNKYICCVDVNDEVVQYVKDKTRGENIEIKRFSHDVLRWNETEKEKYFSMNQIERFELVKEYIDLYANAHCVVTSRLHCALPCLSQKTPVLLVLPRDGRGVSDMEDRMSSYYSMLHVCYDDNFANHTVEYDFKQPPLNSDDYVKYRDLLNNNIQQFINQCENGEINKTYDSRIQDTRKNEYIDFLLQMIDDLKKEKITK